MLEEKYGAEVELVPGVGGVFEITVDGQRKFSKKQIGRFPSNDEGIATGQGCFVKAAPFHVISDFSSRAIVRLTVLKSPKPMLPFVSPRRIFKCSPPSRSS